MPRWMNTRSCAQVHTSNKHTPQMLGYTLSACKISSICQILKKQVFHDSIFIKLAEKTLKYSLIFIWGFSWGLGLLNSQRRGSNPFEISCKKFSATPSHTLNGLVCPCIDTSVKILKIKGHVWCITAIHVHIYAVPENWNTNKNPVGITYCR